MKDYAPDQRDQIVQDYFGPAGVDAPPRCPRCGDTLQFTRLEAQGRRFRLKIECNDCGSGFIWKQSSSRESWLPLHLDYFLERFRSGNRPRCPYDDCYVLCTEFSDGVVEFRCPYCNRRGQKSFPDDLVTLE